MEKRRVLRRKKLALGNLSLFKGLLLSFRPSGLNHNNPVKEEKQGRSPRWMRPPSNPGGGGSGGGGGGDIGGDGGSGGDGGGDIGGGRCGGGDIGGGGCGSGGSDIGVDGGKEGLRITVPYLLKAFSILNLL